MTVYADSSFLVSSYIEDAHSAEADRRMHSSLSVWITPLNRTEFAHALSQYVYRGAFSAVEAQRVWVEFQQDCAEGIWAVVDLPASIWNTSVDLARKYGLTLGIRTLDSLHVACAMELKVHRFWTFDERQARLAKAAGLNTNP